MEAGGPSNVPPSGGTPSGDPQRQPPAGSSSQPPEASTPQDPAPPGWGDPPPAAGTYPPPPAGGTPPTSAKPSGGWWAGAAAIAVALGVGGFLLGQSNGESKAKDDYKAGASGYDAIYNTGYQAGLEKGAAAGEKAGQQTGKSEGEKAGQEKGFTEGEKAGFENGQKAGEVQGTAAGANAALGGFTDWDTSAHYVIRMGAGPSQQVPFIIATRTEMQGGENYALCQSNPATVCVKPEGSGSE